MGKNITEIRNRESVIISFPMWRTHGIEKVPTTVDVKVFVFWMGKHLVLTYLHSIKIENIRKM